MDSIERLRSEYRINLESPRLLLRPFVTEDIDWIAELCADPDVNRFLWDHSDSAEQAKRIAEAMVYLDLNMCWSGRWAIQEKGSGFLHGWAELRKLRPWSGPSDEIALSYVLRPTSWGCGIATEAAGRLLRHAFEVHRLDRVMAVTMAGNTASRRVLEKLGMHRTKIIESVKGKELQYFLIDAPTVKN